MMWNLAVETMSRAGIEALQLERLRRIVSHAYENVPFYKAKMDARGVRLFGEVLRPPEDAVLVRSRDGRTLATDAPLSEGKEWIAGFDFLEVADLDEAIAVASAHPMAATGLMVLSPAWPFDPHDDQVARAARDASDQELRTEPRVGGVS